MSFARAMFSQYGLPLLLSTFVEGDVLITYAFDDVETQCHGIIRDVRVELVQDDDGTWQKRTIGSLVLTRDEYSLFAGVSDPQVKGVFVLRDKCGTDSTWSIVSSEGIAITARTGDLVVVNIMQTRQANRSHVGYRV